MKGSALRTIAIINQKGGCGKTTVSINLAAMLATQGRRTLLVDFDPQAHCALGLSVPAARIERGAAELLRHGLSGSLTLADVAWQAAAGLDLVPSTMALAGIESELREAPDRDRRLAQVLATTADRYEFCIIDCPPSIGLLTFNALRAADEVIIPVETGYFAMQGSVRQEQTIQMLARRVGHHVRLSVLPTMHEDQARLSRELLAEIRRQFGERVLPTTIHFSPKLKEAASFGQPINEYACQSIAAGDFETLARWLAAHPPKPGADLPPGQWTEPQPWTVDGQGTEAEQSAQTAGLEPGKHQTFAQPNPSVPQSQIAGPLADVNQPGVNGDRSNGAAVSGIAAQTAALWGEPADGYAGDSHADGSHWSARPFAPPAGWDRFAPAGQRNPEIAAASATTQASLSASVEGSSSADVSAPAVASAGAPASDTDSASNGGPPSASRSPQPAPPKPALSRAAELVERARALSNHSAQIADRLGASPHEPRDSRRSSADDSPRPATSSQRRLSEARQRVHNGSGDQRESPRPNESSKSRTNGQSNGQPNGHGEANRHRFARLFGARATPRGVLFVQPAKEATHTKQATSVSVAGDFNGWQQADTPLQANGELGLWQTCISIPPGRYRYQLVVDGKAQTDPYNEQTETDPSGQTHNVLEITQ